MLNHITATSAPQPITHLIALDPRTMRLGAFDRQLQSTTRSAHTTTSDPQGDRDPASLASPFCNPDF